MKDIERELVTIDGLDPQEESSNVNNIIGDLTLSLVFDFRDVK